MESDEESSNEEQRNEERISYSRNEDQGNCSGSDSPSSPCSTHSSSDKNDHSGDFHHESDMEISAGSNNESDEEKSDNENLEKRKDTCDSPASPYSPQNSIKSSHSCDESHPKNDMDNSAESGDESTEEKFKSKHEGQNSDSPASPGSDSEQLNNVHVNENDSDNEDANEDIGKKSERENDSDAESDDDIRRKKQTANVGDESDEDKQENDEVDSENKKTMKKRRARIADLSDSDEEIQQNTENIEEPPKPESDEDDEPPIEKYFAKHKKKTKKSRATVSDDSDEGSSKKKEPFVSDFDLMMQKKRENMRRRKRRNVDIINDSDDLIADIINQMRHAAEEDRELNKQKKTALKKLQLLPLVMSQLKKHDLRMAFLDQGVLNAMADWLAPLPDRSLPNLKVREGMLRQLSDFPVIDSSLLKSSGIGRALMYLYKHPRELKENKERAGKLITEWARPIFNVTTDYHSLTKEEREQRDYDHVLIKKKKKEEKKEPVQAKDIDFTMGDTEVKLKPGDKNWVPRARVPMPSNKDYVIRPKWNVESDFGKVPSKKPLNRLEKHMKSLQEKKRNSKSQRAVTISIEGRNMAI